MATSDQLKEVRYYTALDPYYYTVDNRPLSDLDANDLSLARGIDAARSASLVGSVATGILTSGLIGNSSTLVSDLTLPGGLTIELSQGFFASKRNISTADTRQITKLALLVDGFTANLTSPSTAGNSVVHMIQMRHVDVSTGTDGLPAYDPFNPHATGSIITGVVEIDVKTGAEATTGSEVTPTADAGWTRVFAVTVSDTTTDLTTDDIEIFRLQAVGAAAGGGDISGATETSAGIVELATTSEVQALSSTTLAITPAGLNGLTATESRKGILETATTAEANAFSSTSKIMTPARVLDAFNSRNATTTQYGTIRLADNNTANTGTDSTRAVTPASLAHTLSNFDFNASLSAASAGAKGIVELATNAETATGTDTTRAVTPAGLKSVLDGLDVSVSAATFTTAGVARYATLNEVLDGDEASAIVTPDTLVSAMGNDGWLPSATTSLSGTVYIATTAQIAAGTTTGAVMNVKQVTDNFASLSGASFTGDISCNDLTASGEIKGKTFQSTSALQYKTDVTTLDNALDLCAQLRGVNYTWKADGTKDIGFIADEVEKVLPFLVYKDEDGIVQSMDYMHLGAIFANAINELSDLRKEDQKRIAELELQIDYIKTRLDALEA